MIRRCFVTVSSDSGSIYLGPSASSLDFLVCYLNYERKSPSSSSSLANNNRPEGLSHHSLIPIRGYSLQILLPPPWWLSPITTCSTRKRNLHVVCPRGSTDDVSPIIHCLCVAYVFEAILVNSLVTWINLQSELNCPSIQIDQSSCFLHYSVHQRRLPWALDGATWGHMRPLGG